MPSNVTDKNKMVKKKYIQSMQLRFTKRSVLHSIKSYWKSFEICQLTFNLVSNICNRWI